MGRAVYTARFLGARFFDHPSAFVKATFKSGTLTEREVVENWLPTVQLEYALTGCTEVWAIGKMASLFAGEIIRIPKIPEDGQTLGERLRLACQILFP